MYTDDYSNLSFLSELKKYSFDSKMMAAQLFSSRIMAFDEININHILKNNITPFEIETFTLFSIIYDDSQASEPLGSEAFAYFITGIRNYQSKILSTFDSNTEYANFFMMISALTQFPTQGKILFKLYRYDYFFNFVNENLNMKQRFIDFYKTNYLDCEIFAYLIFLYMGLDSQNKFGKFCCQKCVEAAFSLSNVYNCLCIEKEDYIQELRAIYKDKLEDYYYGLKIQYLFPLIGGRNYTYIPSPYLVINAVTESFLNRLTENDDNLRNSFGKEVLENYLFHIYTQLDTVSWSSREISYSDKKLSPDVIVEETDYCIMFDSKSKSPSLCLRKNDKNALEKELKIYAGNIIQLFNRISDYIAGDFSTNKRFSKEYIFGVVVVLEDSYLPRNKIYDKAFEMIEDDGKILNEEERNYIHSHIKICSLRQIENYALRKLSILPALINQASDHKKWDDIEFQREEIETEFSDDFNNYFEKLTSKANQLCLRYYQRKT